MQAQQKNAQRLDWAMSILWLPARGARKARLILGPNGRFGYVKKFDPSTTWLQAVDSIIARREKQPDGTNEPSPA